ncbi:hypothetical protein B0T22DRAFT_430247 [Podospora appendiculata]|uniref:CCHC-type domain-containing protein n=1 Tax=Podospora appendiculata TaxID=314037 RepID=A0AAE0X6M7_9PEZI|nr:hypothetical protein B0T22DRAFT_430247 [Podospora appendiculata]
MSSSESSAGRKRPAAGADTRTSFKKSRVDSPGQANRSAELDEGEIREGNGVSSSGSPESNESVAEVPRTGHVGWNRGAGTGLRTSFAGLGKSNLGKSSGLSQSLLDSSAPQAALSSDDEPETRVTDSWIKPAGFLHFKKRPHPNRGDSWQSRFETWAEVLIGLNKEKEGVRDPLLLQEAWYHWLDNQTLISIPRRADAQKQSGARKLAPEKLQEMLSWAESAQPARAPEQGASKANVKTSAPSTKLKPSSWTLPPIPADPYEHYGLNVKDHDGWKARFAQWCQALIFLNHGRIDVKQNQIDRKCVEAYSKWIGTDNMLSKNKTSAARRAANEYVDGGKGVISALAASVTFSDEVPETVKWAYLLRETKAEPTPITAAPPEAIATDGQANGRAEAGEDEDEDDHDEFQQTYFPGLSSADKLCMMCASHDHTSVECPELTCRFCHEQDHPSYNCPTRRRCSKCKQLGHLQKDCREKLSLAQEEMECAFCQSRDHTDALCVDLWRSWSPNPIDIHRVNALPVYCYTCGHEGHYGPDCGLNPDPKGTAWDTWSQANCDQYLDAECAQVAIAFNLPAGAVVDFGTYDERPSFGGKNIVPQRHKHIVFESEEDDDENEGFIRPPVQSKTRSGITIGFNTGHNGDANYDAKRGGGRRNNNNTTNGRNPPLPPGPPPQDFLPQRRSNARGGGNPGRGRGRGRGGRGGGGGGGGGKRGFS